jgi:hypothetical protein
VVTKCYVELPAFSGSVESAYGSILFFLSSLAPPLKNLQFEIVLINVIIVILAKRERCPMSDTEQSANVDQLKAELNVERMRRAVHTARWSGFAAGAAFMAAVAIAVFMLAINPPHRRALASSEAKLESVTSERDDLQKDADRFSNIAETSLQDAKKSSTQLTQSTQEFNNQLAECNAQMRSIQEQAKLVVADLQLQAEIQKHQQAPQSSQNDSTFALLDLIRPGLGSTIKKLQLAHAQQPGNN